MEPAPPVRCLSPALASLLVLLVGCDGAHRAAPERVGPAEQSLSTSAPAAATPTDQLHGRWTGEALCFSLFENGDFELIVNGEPKVMIMGTATARDDGALALTTTRIWRTRFVGPCRRIHEFGRFAGDQSALGETFRPGQTVVVRLSRPSANVIELCASECATFQRGEPVVGAEWRLAGLADAHHPPAPYEPGQLVAIDIAAHGWLWSGISGAGLARVSADVTFVPEGSDRFRLTVTPTGVDDAPAGARLTLLGSPLVVGEPRALRARRLSGERLSVCDGDRCNTLERAFDGDEYELY